MERKAVVETLASKVHEVCNRIGGFLEIQFEHDLAFVRLDSSLDRFDAGVILVKDLPFGKHKRTQARKEYNCKSKKPIHTVQI